MATLVVALREIVVAAGLSAGTVFLIEAPPNKDLAVVLRPYASSAEIDIPVGWQSVQCMTRAPTFAASEDYSWKAFNAIISSAPVCDRLIFSVVPRQEPFFLDRDDAGRYRHVFNISVFLAHKEV